MQNLFNNDFYFSAGQIWPMRSRGGRGKKGGTGWEGRDGWKRERERGTEGIGLRAGRGGIGEKEGSLPHSHGNRAPAPLHT